MAYFMAIVIGILNSVAWLFLYRWGYNSGYEDGADDVMDMYENEIRKERIRLELQEANK